MTFDARPRRNARIREWRRSETETELVDQSFPSRSTGAGMTAGVPEGGRADCIMGVLFFAVELKSPIVRSVDE